MPDNMIVLAIDDNVQQLNEFNSILTPKYDLRAAKSASDAISYLNKNKADVILLDIQMPHISGFEFLEDIKMVPSHSETPIIIVSGTVGNDFVEKALAAGAADVLKKPVSQDQLTEAIEKALAAG